MGSNLSEETAPILSGEAGKLNMDKLKYTSDLYGKGHFKYAIDNLKLPEGFVAYHKNNYSKYFNLPQSEFKNLNVLETGAGCGRHAIVLALLGANVIATDLSPENIERGKELKKYYNLSNVQFYQHDFTAPFKSQIEFDLVSAHNWVQHTENPSLVIWNLLSSLKKGGKIYLSLYLARTFRFFIAQIARGVLKLEWYDLMKEYVKFHFPTGFRGFNNPDDICMEIIFDDFFVPYCNTVTYEILMHDAELLNCKPITPKPPLGDTHGVDCIYLRMGFQKCGEASFSNSLQYTREIDEFSAPMPDHVKESAALSNKIISHFGKLNDPVAACSFCLGLFRVRAETSRTMDGFEKHKLLQSYLNSVLDNSVKSISLHYDTAGLWDEARKNNGELPAAPGAIFY